MNPESVPPRHTEGASRVLVVEDEPALAKVVANYLAREGFQVRIALDGPSAVAAAHEFEPSLVVLDLMLPGFDGMEVCRRIRSFSDAYILMLSARGDESDKVMGLAAGADDYVVKPFGPRELVARVKALLRRPRASSLMPEPLQTPPGLDIDVLARTVLIDGSLVDLTPTEFELLAALAARPDTALSRSDIIAAVWGSSWYGDQHIVDVHIRALRRKLGDDASDPRFIRTVRSVGYALRAS
ncbi:response regulator transcription factor [Rhodococcus sp. ARC_M6]|uniref:response regulator transcription factor n=1 Tax=Rhodococcus sp. ARC_M6 TaxID=2928852 RepID=UPI001FB36294|nr:response regulator transcription factor [Rhodococcus sp. ARC_M6]MCJ0902978.1 response regulator transcription factor [Rhodococcus sp. ARC_M6]